MEYDFDLNNLSTILILKNIKGKVLKVSKEVDASFYTMHLVKKDVYYDDIKQKYWKKNTNIINSNGDDIIQEEYIDVTSLVIENKQLSMELKRDPLTKIGNVRALTIKEKEILLTNKSCAMVICDVDNFKNINDTFGHSMGDIALQGIAQILVNNKNDEYDCVARIGGDEFFLIFDTDNVNDIIEKMSIIQKEVRKLGKDLNIPLFISIGISFFSSYSDELLKKQKIYEKKQEADQALYYVKKKVVNKNNIAYYNSDTKEIELYDITDEKIKLKKY